MGTGRATSSIEVARNRRKRLNHAGEVVTQLRAITSVVMPDASYVRNCNAEHRELAVRSAPGGRRGDISQSRRLAAILAADLGGVLSADASGQGHAGEPQSVAPRAVPGGLDDPPAKADSHR